MYNFDEPVDETRLLEIAEFGFGRPGLTVGGHHPARIFEDLEYVGRHIEAFSRTEHPLVTARLFELAERLKRNRPWVASEAYQQIAISRLEETGFADGWTMLAHATQLLDDPRESLGVLVDQFEHALLQTNPNSNEDVFEALLSVSDFLDEKGEGPRAMSLWRRWVHQHGASIDPVPEHLSPTTRTNLVSWIESAEHYFAMRQIQIDRETKTFTGYAHVRALARHKTEVGDYSVPSEELGFLEPQDLSHERMIDRRWGLSLN